MLFGSGLTCCVFLYVVVQAVVLDSQGATPALSVLTSGFPCALYTRGPNLAFVRGLELNGAVWSTPIVIRLNAGSTMRQSLTIVNGNPAYCAAEDMGGNRTRLIYVRADDAFGDSWTSTGVVLDSNPVNATGQYCCIAVTNTTVIVAYYDSTLQRIAFRKSTDNGATWAARVVVVRPLGAQEGPHLSMTLLSGNQVAFASSAGLNVLYTHTQDPADSTFEDYGPVWNIPSTQSVSPCILQLSGISRPAIFHSDNGMGWRFQYTLPNNWVPTATPGYFFELGFSFLASQQATFFSDEFSCALVTGNPAAVYYDSTNQQLRYAFSQSAQGNTTWVLVTVDAAAGSDIGRSPSFVPSLNGNPAVAYAVNSSLVFSRARSVDGTSGWDKQPPVSITTFVPPPGVTTLTGNVTLSNSSVIVISGGSSIVVTGVINLGGSLVVSSSVSGNFSLVSAQQVNGQFASVTVAPTSSQCPVSATPYYSTVSVFVAISVSLCGTTNPPTLGLSSGAIAGIVIGCVAFAVLIAVSVILLRKHLRRRDDSTQNRKLAASRAQQGLSAQNLPVVAL